MNRALLLLVAVAALWPTPARAQSWLQPWPVIVTELGSSPAGDGYHRLTVTAMGGSRLGLLVSAIDGSLEAASATGTPNTLCVRLTWTEAGREPWYQAACGMWLQYELSDPPGAAAVAIELPPDVHYIRIQFEKHGGELRYEEYFVPEGTRVTSWQYAPLVGG